MNARTPPLLTAWIIGCVVCVTAGWLLSALRQLNGTGYLIGALAVAVVGVGSGARIGGRALGRTLGRWRRRGRRSLPLVFALLAALSLLGGLLHAPSNYDALTYRLPRVLHWLAEGGWHWMTTPNLRANLSGANSEWLMAPCLAWFHSDRPLFLVNWTGYLFLPGLVFSVFRLAGVPGRVAWWWMWLLPAGYGYVLQAGSVGNDLLGAVFALAAVHYALLARRTGAPSALFLAALSAALLSGTKVTNLPLLLPCAVAMWPARRLARQRALATGIVLLLAALVSFLPTAVLNHRQTGHWSGDTADTFQVKATNPIVALLGNTLQVGVRNLEPPALPSAARTEALLLRGLTPGMVAWIRGGFPRFSLRLGEMPQEESAALGLGVFGMLVISTVVALRRWRCLPALAGTHGFWIGIGAWIATGTFAAQVAVEATPRLLLPYYLLLPLPFLLAGRSPDLTRRRWWRWCALAASASATVGLVLTPARPLWPARTLTRELGGTSPVWQRVRAVYEAYSQRNDALGDLRRQVPDSVSILGFIGGEDDIEYALWRPLGRRQLHHLYDGLQFDSGKRPPVEWVIVKEKTWTSIVSLPFDDWVATHHGARVAEEHIVSKVSVGPETWWVARFPNAQAVTRP